jgi:hypothetical protein
MQGDHFKVGMEDSNAIRFSFPGGNRLRLPGQQHSSRGNAGVSRNPGWEGACPNG